MTKRIISVPCILVLLIFTCTGLQAAVPTNLADIGGPSSNGPQKLLPLPVPAEEVLWDNGDTDGVNGISNAVVGVFGFRRTVFDDFVVPDGQTWTITDLHWIHLWNSLAPPQGSDLELAFYSDNSGPDTLLETANVTSYSEAATGRTWFSRPEAQSSVEFDPIVLGPGHYWFEATIVGPENNFWMVKNATREQDCWVDYDDLGGLQTCFTQFVDNFDLAWQLTGSDIVYSDPVDPIANGSFELPDRGACNFDNPATDDPLGVDDWTIGGTIDHICQLWTAAEGDQSLDMSGDSPGSVSQTLTSLDDNHPYKVTFELSGNPANAPQVNCIFPEIKDLEVDVGGAPTLYQFDTTGEAIPGITWVSQEFVFTASSDTALLTFESLENSNCGPALDDVNLFFGNRAPVANDDSYDAVENTPLVVLTVDRVLDNDTDADLDPLTAVAGGTSPSNGTLDPFNDDGSFTYTPNDDFCGTDTFTYTAKDNYDAVSAEATVTINVACRPDITSVSPGSQTVQYSDGIIPVTISATDDDSPTSDGDLVLSFPADSWPNNVTETSGSCIDSGDGQTCSWTYGGAIDDPAAVLDIEFTVTDPDGNTNTCSDSNNCEHALTIVAEEAVVTLDDVFNPIDVHIVDAGSITLKYTVWELGFDDGTDDEFQIGGAAYSGFLERISESIQLVPVGPGGPVDPDSCSNIPEPFGTAGQYDDEVEFTCEFLNVEVNTYEVVAKVDNGYYVGSDEGVLVVYDPSLGFTTGGGFFYWPGTVQMDEQDPCYPYEGDKTNFGFTFKYNKKQKNVQGSLLMMRHWKDPETCVEGNWKVKSNATDGLSIGSAADADGDYGWAAVAGKATFRDPTEENSGGNEFLFYVEDHGEQGCSQDPSDEIWIEVDALNIWDDPLGPNPADDTDPFVDGDDVPIFCGNIVVPHTTGKKGGGGGKPN